MYIRYLRKLVVITLAGILFNSLSYSQLQMNVTTANVHQLNPSQFDFQNFQSSVWLFTINISFPGTHDVRFTNGQITVTLIDGTVVRLLEGDGFYSGPFTVTERKTITNLDLGKNGEIRVYNFTLSAEGRSKILEPAFATGRFPGGSYNINIKIEDAQNPQNSDSKIINLQLEDVSQIELRYPRDGEITNEFPLFEWLYDGQEVELIINEKLPGMSFEESISRFPVTYQNIFFGGQNSFQYPASGVRPLEKGKSYVWTVIGKIQSQGGKTIQSSMGHFIVEQSSSLMQESDLIEQIEICLGNKWKNITNKIISDDLEPSEKYFLNNTRITETELKEILKFLQNNPDNIVKVVVE